MCSSDLIDALAEHLDAAGSFINQGGNYADDRGLSSTIWPQQRKEIPLLYVEGDALEGFRSVGVNLVYIFE